MEIIEERLGADRLVGHFEVVYSMIPVVLNFFDHQL
jgi:hypothetical protein